MLVQMTSGSNVNLSCLSPQSRHCNKKWWKRSDALPAECVAKRGLQWFSSRVRTYICVPAVRGQGTRVSLVAASSGELWGPSLVDFYDPQPPEKRLWGRHASFLSFNKPPPALRHLSPVLSIAAAPSSNLSNTPFFFCGRFSPHLHHLTVHT